MAWLFDTPGKYAAALLAAAVVFVVLALLGLRSGEVRMRGGTVRRVENPGLFIFVVAFLVGIAGICALAAWIAMTGVITPPR